MRSFERYIIKGGQRLRCGYTTGSCAAAAAYAAAYMLLAGEKTETVTVHAPGGEYIDIDVESYEIVGGAVRCTVKKDAGDDPDVTDGAFIGCTVSKTASGIIIDGANGVGKVTRPGLACAVGEAAINPEPKKMIAGQLEIAREKCGYTGGLKAVIDVPDGERLASGTFNPRLGIVGGISILGTTGIVKPMSESALVATIHAELDSRFAAGSKKIIIVPGNYGADFAKKELGISLDGGIKCSNFIGEAIDYAIFKGFLQILLLGHAGKLVKVSAGIMNTHSRTADARSEILAAHAGMCGLSAEAVNEIYNCATVEAADQALAVHGAEESVWQSIGKRLEFQLSYRVKNRAEIAFAAFLSRGIVMQSENFIKILEEVRQ